MTERDPDLESLFAEARSAKLSPSDALMARVMADAAALQPRATARQVALSPRGWLDQLAWLFGGGPALAGMGVATVAGLMIGLAQPAPVLALTAAFGADSAFDSLDLVPDPDALWAEN